MTALKSLRSPLTRAVLSIFCAVTLAVPVFATGESAVAAPKPATKDTKASAKEAAKPETATKPAAKALAATEATKTDEATTDAKKEGEAATDAASQFNTIEDIYSATWVPTWCDEPAEPVKKDGDEKTASKSVD